MVKNKGLLIVVSGFSGAGKDTLVKKLMEDNDNYVLSVSITTRKPREGEKDKVDYFFGTKEEFEELIKQNQFLEYAKYTDNYYGTPRKFVEDKLSEGKNVVLIIEVQGALIVKERFPEALLVFVTPPSIKELERRLMSRGTETKEQITGRIMRAAEEAKSIKHYEYIVVNDDLERAAGQLDDIVETAKRAVSRNMNFVKELSFELDNI